MQPFHTDRLIIFEVMVVCRVGMLPIRMVMVVSIMALAPVVRMVVCRVGMLPIRMVMVVVVCRVGMLPIFMVMVVSIMALAPVVRTSMRA
ncbi:MAG: hypothetical protein HQL63_07610 [Magnetococcales bacterium]|nr:hypothetical protein [Magnetococcales bacterium]